MARYLLELSAADYWRAIILYGLNTATYKLALGQCLVNFTTQGKTRVSMSELAEEFFDIYKDRLENGKPQLDHVSRRTVMETIVELYNLGKLTRNQAIEEVEKRAFDDVIPRFHTVYRTPVEVQFYEHTSTGLILTDSLYAVFEHGDSQEFRDELDSRWSLLEAAFEMKRERSTLANDIMRFYLRKGNLARSDVTHTIPVLNGYQEGVCFYCGEKMPPGSIHVDHFIPWKVVRHDEIWNLVLAHGFCNEQKSDALPARQYLEKLIMRNEYFIASNHPIKNKLIAALGDTRIERRRCILEHYERARHVVKHTWDGIRGYNPGTDKFYKTFIRRIYRC
ncbi:MAG: HNH endonuclease [Firmicutes bacterium]|nr:HNH endonuclease [Bacillota bacterium]